MAPPKRGRGRPAKYGSDAERAAAYRERKADGDAAAHIALALHRRPTAKLLEVLVARLLRQTSAKGAALGGIRAAVDRGIAAGYAPAPPQPDRQGDIESWLADTESAGG